MSDTDWYLLDRGGRRYGPYDREVIERLALKHELQPSTPVWHPGLARWQRAERVIGLPKSERVETSPVPPSVTTVPVRPRSAPAPAAPPPQSRRVATPQSATAPAGIKAPRPQARPAVPKSAAKFIATTMTPPEAARRVFAALFDVLCLFAAFSLMRRGIQSEGLDGLRRASPLFFLSWAALDAACTVRFGSTPGKALMAINVHSAQDENLAWPRALVRSGALPLLLMFLSLRTGFTILVAVVVLIFTVSRVRGGFAPWWDDIAAARVSYGELPASRRALAVIAFLALLAVMIIAIP